MIYYKVLITLTVIFITSCSGGPQLKDYNDCEESLKKVGFSVDFGFINYCFAKQFEDIDQFKKHVKEEYDNTVPATIDILLAFFEVSTSYSNAGDDLYDPRTFCMNNINNKKILSCVTCIKINVSLDDPMVDNCTEKIVTIDDGEIGKIKKLYDANGNKTYISKIDYGKNKIKNAIKSYNLSMQTPLTIQIAKRFWPAIAVKYYNDQMATLNKKEKSEMFFTTKKWCEKKKAEAKAAEEKTAAKNV